ncbi:hypothetical protein N9250_02105, partial [bacterium]|nr:hypothetical protein [bacterium]
LSNDADLVASKQTKNQADLAASHQRTHFYIKQTALHRFADHPHKATTAQCPALGIMHPAL